MVMFFLLVILMFASIDSPVAGIALGIVFVCYAYYIQKTKDILQSRDTFKMVVLGYPMGFFFILHGFYRLCSP